MTDATTGATDVTTDATTDTTASRSFGEGEQPEMHAARLRDGPATDAAKRRLVTSLFWALPPEAHRDGSFIHSTDDAIAAALLHADHESEPSDAGTKRIAVGAVAVAILQAHEALHTTRRSLSEAREAGDAQVMELQKRACAEAAEAAAKVAANAAAVAAVLAATSEAAIDCVAPAAALAAADSPPADSAAAAAPASARFFSEGNLDGTRRKAARERGARKRPRPSESEHETAATED